MTAIRIICWGYGWSPAGLLLSGGGGAWIQFHTAQGKGRLAFTAAARSPAASPSSTVRIADSPNLFSTGTWSTVLAQFLVTTVVQQPDVLVYHFTLKPGATLSPGSYAFGVQYNYAVGGRDSSRDTYHVVATAGGTGGEASGGF
jgi:hypothetical protein